MNKLTKADPEFFSKISQMRKKKSGGMYFKDKEKAREAQRKGIESRRRRKEASQDT